MLINPSNVYVVEFYGLAIQSRGRSENFARVQRDHRVIEVGVERLVLILLCLLLRRRRRVSSRRLKRLIKIADRRDRISAGGADLASPAASPRRPLHGG